MGLPNTELSALLALPAESRLEPLTRLATAMVAARAHDQSVDPGFQGAVAEALTALLESGAGDGRTRLVLGEALGHLGDPRLRLPDQPDYWALVDMDGYSLRIARYPVTVWEWRRWVEAGNYQRDEWWDEAGRAWRDSGAQLWPDMARDPDLRPFLVPNQPVVGVTWHEAMAYARSFRARLPERAERSHVVRGQERRPYPWGEPFGTGRANTREEVMGRPCAVGLYRLDRTPEGVFDLAGNVGEWTVDEVGDKRVYHPGSWRQPSMASWAKALALRAPGSRSDDLGFRLAADLT